MTFFFHYSLHSYLMYNSSIKDCSTPSETGYVFTGTTATTYLGTSNVACATGYDGTASPAQIQCEASGSWTVVTGCTIKGKIHFLFACTNSRKFCQRRFNFDNVFFFHSNLF